MRKVRFSGVEEEVHHLLVKMKFMKLGSKPDSFQADGNNVR